MKKERTVRANTPLIALALPIILENYLRITLTSVDVFMLSSYSAKAVAAVGLIGNFSFLLILLYSIVSSGANTVISQHLGGERLEQAGLAALASYGTGLAFALVLSLFMASMAGPVLSLYKLEDQVRTYARQYLVIYGGGSVFLGLNIISANILRSYGYTRYSMMCNMIANVCNVIGNAVSLYGPFGLPVFGVKGVAVSTVASQLIALVLMTIQIRRRKDILVPWKKLFRIPADYIRQILKIGVPSGGESLSYNLSQIVLSGFIAALGTSALNANVYTITVVRYVFVPSMSIGFATQIKIGYLVGAGRFAEAKTKMYRYLGLGFLLSAFLILLLYLIRLPVLRLFTDDSSVIVLASSLLFISIFREVGRVVNLITIPGLRGSGDVFFPVIIGIIFQWSVGVGGAAVFSGLFGWGLPGIWLAVTIDEWLRSAIMIARWKSGAWQTKALQ